MMCVQMRSSAHYFSVRKKKLKHFWMLTCPLHSCVCPEVQTSRNGGGKCGNSKTPDFTLLFFAPHPSCDRTGYIWLLNRQQMCPCERAHLPCMGDVPVWGQTGCLTAARENFFSCFQNTATWGQCNWCAVNLKWTKGSTLFNKWLKHWIAARGYSDGHKQRWLQKSD